MKFHPHKYEVKDGNGFHISEMDTAADVKKPKDEELHKILGEDIAEMASLQNKLYAEDRQSLLIVLQGMDSAGKDSTIKHIMSGMNPQGLLVRSFKHPSAIELQHDYLWRHTVDLPGKGQITIFNRSHYENVLISKVHPEIVLNERIPGILSIDDVDKGFWNERYRQINDFEKIVMKGGTHILKFFLHISKKEQRSRFLDRIEHKDKHWKFSSADITERGFWSQYQHAYQDAIRHTCTPDAPWYVIPSDDKWFARLLIGKAILEKMKKMDPKFPAVDGHEKELMAKAKEQLGHEE